MNKSDSTSHNSASQASGPQKLSVGREIADTTWRMTVPVVLFAFIGIFIDIKLGSKPWITLLGMIVGFMFAALLVKHQIERSQESN